MDFVVKGLTFVEIMIILAALLGLAALTIPAALMTTS